MKKKFLQGMACMLMAGTLTTGCGNASRLIDTNHAGTQSESSESEGAAAVVTESESAAAATESESAAAVVTESESTVAATESESAAAVVTESESAAAVVTESESAAAVVTESESAVAPTETVSESSPDISAESGTEAGMAQSFQAGTWYALSSAQVAQYYFFSGDGASGQTMSTATGMGVSFSYVWQGSEVTFYMGSADSALQCLVDVTDESHMILNWSDGTTESLSYVSEEGADRFSFYTDEELCNMALAYYQQLNGEDSSLQAAAADNGDGSVTIQIYENLGDHNSTAAWYSVDRVSGAGTNVSSGESIQLS